MNITNRELAVVAIVAVVSAILGAGVAAPLIIEKQVDKQLDKKIDTQLAAEVEKQLDKQIDTKLSAAIEKEVAEYSFGIALLVGSAAHPAANGKVSFEARIAKNERVFKVALEGVPELAKATLNVSIDGTFVGNLLIDGKGIATLSIRVRGVEPFPTVAVGSLVEVKTADGTLVASGTF